MITGIGKLPEKVLCMRAGDMKVCLDVSCVVKVILLPHLERSSVVSTGLIGMLNYAGQSINIMDLYTLLSGNREEAYTLDNSIVIVSNENDLSGYMIDEVYDIKDVDIDNVKSTNNAASIIFNEDIYLLLNSHIRSQGNV